jgi:hypothetical protein
LTWTRLSNDKRLWDRGWYFEKITADPKDADTVYVMNTSMYKSTDAGKTWTASKAHREVTTIINFGSIPRHETNDHGQRSGSIVQSMAPRRWSSWYNQPTAQIYHVAPDYRFPYWITGAQQDSGAVGSPSRSRHSEISNRDWEGLVLGGESGYTAPDPCIRRFFLAAPSRSATSSRAKRKMFLPNAAGTPGQFRHAWTSRWSSRRPIRDRSISPTNFFTRRRTAARVGPRSVRT